MLSGADGLHGEFARAASDGTSFFVYAQKGELFRIAADGTVLSQESGPLSHESHGIELTFDGSTGWMLAARGPQPRTYDAQRFDANGAKVGEAITISPGASSYVSAFVADGSDLLYVRSTLVTPGAERIYIDVYVHTLVRVDSAGTVVSEVELGRGIDRPTTTPLGGDPGGPLVVATRVGSSIAVAWTSSWYSHQLAIVTP